MPELPSLNDAQRRIGHERSLALRRVRAEFKAQLTEQGWVYLAEHWELEDIQGMKIGTLLRCLPGVGTKKAARLLAEAAIPQNSTVTALGHRQKDRLFALLDR